MTGASPSYARAYYEDACGIFGIGVYYLRKWGDNMARDMAKKNIADYRWAKENCMRLNMKIRNDSGIPEALERMKETGQSANSYAIAALVTQLRKDGYLPESPKTE